MHRGHPPARPFSYALCRRLPRSPLLQQHHASTWRVRGYLRAAAVRPLLGDDPAMTNARCSSMHAGIPSNRGGRAAVRSGKAEPFPGHVRRRGGGRSTTSSLGLGPARRSSVGGDVASGPRHAECAIVMVADSALCARIAVAPGTTRRVLATWPVDPVLPVMTRSAAPKMFAASWLRTSSASVHDPLVFDSKCWRGCAPYRGRPLLACASAPRALA